jgi:hypothetical protein
MSWRTTFVFLALVGLVTLAACGLPGGGDDAGSGGGSGAAQGRAKDRAGKGDPEEPVFSKPGDQSNAGREKPQLVRIRPGLVDPRPNQIQDLEPRGPQTVRLSFWDGIEECYGVDHVKVAYGKKAVSFTLYTGRVDADVICTEQAVFKAVDVRLDEPLRGRKVAEGSG